MQSTRHDANLAALHASSGLPGTVLDVVVLTTDTGLLATLREASGQEHAIWHAQSADQAVDLLVGGRCGILIADLGTLRGDAASLLDRLGAQFPELILLATGRREEEGTVAGLVGKGLIYRFLHKPISPARASLFISTATRRYHELRNVEPIALSTARTMATQSHLGKLIAAAVVLIVAIAAFFIWRSQDSDLAPSIQPKQTNVRTTEEQVTELLASGQMAYATGRFHEPRGDNALEYFRGVLKLQPENTDARAGVERVIMALETRVRAALEARNPRQGAIALTALQRADPNHPQLDALRAELVAISRSARPVLSPSAPAASVTTRPAPASPPRAVAVSPQEAAPRSKATPESVTDDAAAKDAAVFASAPDVAQDNGPGADEIANVVRLRERGALISPAGSNAYEGVIALRERYPNADAVASEQQRLAFVLLDRTRTSLAAGEIDDAAAFLSHADSLVPGMMQVKTLRERLAIAQEQQAFMKNVVPAGTLKRVREVAPDYPRDAERAGTQGWVDVELTVAPDGTTQDLVVRGAEPVGVFEKAAVDSVRRWKFAPVMKDGQAVRQRAILRVRFVLR